MLCYFILIMSYLCCIISTNNQKYICTWKLSSLRSFSSILYYLEKWYIILCKSMIIYVLVVQYVMFIVYCVHTYNYRVQLTSCSRPYNRVHQFWVQLRLIIQLQLEKQAVAVPLQQLMKLPLLLSRRLANSMQHHSKRWDLNWKGEMSLWQSLNFKVLFCGVTVRGQCINPTCICACAVWDGVHYLELNVNTYSVHATVCQCASYYITHTCTIYYYSTLN